MMDLTYEDIILDHDGGGSSFKWIVLVSLSFHIVALWFVMMVLPGLTSYRAIPSPTEDIIIVTPEGLPGTRLDSPKPYEPSEDVAETTPETTVPEPIRPAAPTENKTHTKPETAPRTPAVDPEKILRERIEKIRTKVEARNRTAPQTTATPGRPNMTANMIDSRIRDHIVLMSNIVRANWQMPSEGMMKGADMDKVSAAYEVLISPDGTVAGMEFSEKSGVPAFDISVENAMKRATFPKTAASLENGFAVRFRFTPTGVKTGNGPE